VFRLRPDPDDVVGFAAAALAKANISEIPIRPTSSRVKVLETARDLQLGVVIDSQLSLSACSGRCMSQRLLPATAAPTIRQIHVT